MPAGLIKAFVVDLLYISSASTVIVSIATTSFGIALEMIENKKLNYINETQKSKQSKKISNAYKRHIYQLDKVKDGLTNAEPDDIIIVGDLDEIPNLEYINFDNIKNKLIFFKQKMFYYKLNLFYKELVWTGSRACKRKKLKSPQWLRNVKNKKYPFWRIDTFFSNNKYTNIKFVDNGGWHFTNMKNPEEIFLKFNSFLHNVDFKFSGLNLEDVKKMVSEKKILYDHFADQKKLDKWDSEVLLHPVQISELPKYIAKNKDKFKNWLDEQ